MASLKMIKRKIASVNSTKQIMKAMNLVSASKLQKAKAPLKLIRPMYTDLKLVIDGIKSSEGSEDNVFVRKRDVKSIAYLILTSDRGLCGGYKMNISKEAFAHMTANADKPENIIVAPKNLCDPKTTRRKIITSIVFGFIIGQAMLIIGAFLLVDHGVRLATMFGISETVVGLTAIAVGTSMPELITCITSIRRKSSGLALGNVIGSNIISCTLLIGICAVIGDLNGTFTVSQSTFLISIPFLFLVYLIAIVPMLLRRRTYRWQGIALLALYALYVTYLIATQPI